jgi:simple sugar transport system permease protein
VTLLEAYLASGVRFSTPLLLAALGGLATWWTRDLNIGLEGFMLFGSFFAVLTAYQTGSSILAVVLTVLAGALIGLLFGLVVVGLRANVFVVGAAVNVLALGGTVFLLRIVLGTRGSFSSPDLPALPRLTIPVVDAVPLVGGLLSGHTVLTYLSWLLVAVVAWAARHTVLVRRLKAAGEHREALQSAGRSVRLVRLLAQVWCAALCALAGMQLSLGQLTLFTEGMTAGKGFVALAAVIFSGGGAAALLAVCLLFGFTESLSVRMESLGLPPQFPQMLPYVVTLIGLVVVSLRRRGDDVRVLVPTPDEP